MHFKQEAGGRCYYMHELYAVSFTQNTSVKLTYKHKLQLCLLLRT